MPRTRKQADANCASAGNWCQEQENKPMQIVQVQATGAKNKKSTGNWCQEQENKLMQIVQVQETGGCKLCKYRQENKKKLMQIVQVQATGAKNKKTN